MRDTQPRSWPVARSYISAVYVYRVLLPVFSSQDNLKTAKKIGYRDILKYIITLKY